MKLRLYLFIISVLLTGCQRSNKVKTPAEYYDHDQDQFTFLVFDKSKVDTFFTEFEPLQYSNSVIKSEVMKLADMQFESVQNKSFGAFDKNSRMPEISDWYLAKKIMKATYEKDGEQYFSGSLEYLFFYKCLPNSFQSKWTQTILGDFRFNVTFFALLRDKSEVIDKMIYGDIAFVDEKLVSIFGTHIFNEITPDRARQVKEVILKDESFNDVRFKTDRDNFIYFLDKTISNEWRLILTDWN